MLKHKSWILFIFLFFQIIQGCSLEQKNILPNERSADEYVKTELIFGLCKNDLCVSENDFVSEKEWTDFLDNQIAPLFTEGLTVVDSKGQWMNKSGKPIKEKSKIVIILYPNTKKAEESIERIREKYRILFHQESVLKIKHPKVDVSF